VGAACTRLGGRPRWRCGLAMPPRGRGHRARTTVAVPPARNSAGCRTDEPQPRAPPPGRLGARRRAHAGARPSPAGGERGRAGGGRAARPRGSERARSPGGGERRQEDAHPALPVACVVAAAVGRAARGREPRGGPTSSSSAPGRRASQARLVRGKEWARLVSNASEVLALGAGCQARGMRRRRRRRQRPGVRRRPAALEAQAERLPGAQTPPRRLLNGLATGQNGGLSGGRGGREGAPNSVRCGREPPARRGLPSTSELAFKNICTRAKARWIVLRALPQASAPPCGGGIPDAANAPGRAGRCLPLAGLVG
jgi:hypothetical protein